LRKTIYAVWGAEFTGKRKAFWSGTELRNPQSRCAGEKKDLEAPKKAMLFPVPSKRSASQEHPPNHVEKIQQKAVRGKGAGILRQEKSIIYKP